MADKFPMTPAGNAWMKKQLNKLKNVDRPANARAIEVARGHGDLSENADYSAAKEEQGMIEAKIREFEAKLALAEVIDPARMSGEKVMFGATVTIEDTENGDELRYTIVGEHEANIKKGKISIGAPVARALIGKSVGDAVAITTPKGKRELEVVKVEWLEVAGPDETAVEVRPFEICSGQRRPGVGDLDPVQTVFESGEPTGFNDRAIAIGRDGRV